MVMTVNTIFVIMSQRQHPMEMTFNIKQQHLFFGPKEVNILIHHGVLWASYILGRPRDGDLVIDPKAAECWCQQDEKKILPWRMVM